MGILELNKYGLFSDVPLDKRITKEHIKTLILSFLCTVVT